MVLLCKVISGDELEVSHAVLLQNKDELQIPLEFLGMKPVPVTCDLFLGKKNMFSFWKDWIDTK